MSERQRECMIGRSGTRLTARIAQRPPAGSAAGGRRETVGWAVPLCAPPLRRNSHRRGGAIATAMPRRPHTRPPRLPQTSYLAISKDWRRQLAARRRRPTATRSLTPHPRPTPHKPNTPPTQRRRRGPGPQEGQGWPLRAHEGQLGGQEGAPRGGCVSGGEEDEGRIAKGRGSAPSRPVTPPTKQMSHSSHQHGPANTIRPRIDTSNHLRALKPSPRPACLPVTKPTKQHPPTNPHPHKTRLPPPRAPPPPTSSRPRPRSR